MTRSSPSGSDGPTTGAGTSAGARRSFGGGAAR